MLSDGTVTGRIMLVMTWPLKHGPHVLHPVRPAKQCQRQ
jgi:hypothetical protein